MSARGRRALAIATAGAAIVGGLAIRDGDGGGGAEGPGDGGEYTLVEDDFEADDEVTWFFEDGQEPAVRCIVELSDVCQELGDYWEIDVTVEPLWATLAAIRDGTLGPGELDGWVTLAPFGRLAVPEAGEPFLTAGDEPIARSALAGLGAPERIAALRRACLEDVTGLVCAFEQAGRDWSELGGEPGWGTLRPTLPDPEVTGIGVLALAVLLEEQAGGEPLTVEALATPEGRARVDDLAAAGARLTVDPAEDMARLGPAGGDVTVGAEAGGIALLDYGEDDEIEAPLVPTYPTRLMMAEVELLVTDGYALTDQLRLVMTESTASYTFGDHGWETPEDGVPYLADHGPVWEDRPTAPPTNQVPDPEALVALRTAWQEATARGPAPAGPAPADTAAAADPAGGA